MTSDELAQSEGCYLDHKAAERVSKFFTTFVKHSKSPFEGKPLDLLPWQYHDIILPLFGWKRKDGTRRFRRCSIWCPKKQGKSFLCSAIAIYMLLADNEHGANVILLANTIEQASTLYEECANIVDQSKELSKRLWVRRNLKTIEYAKTKSKLKVLSGDKLGKRGPSVSCVIWDEIAEPSAYQREIYGDLQYSGSARKQPLFLTISTSGYDKSSLGWELFSECTKIKEAKTDEAIRAGITYLPVIYSVPETEDWRSEDVWKRYVPSLNHTVQLDTYREARDRALNNPRLETDFRTFLLCQWVGSSQQWIPTNIWDRCKQSFAEEDFYNTQVVIGYDGARKLDLASYVIIAKKDDHFFLIPRFFIPEETAKVKEQRDHVPYTYYTHMGLVNATPGDIIDPRCIRESLVQDSKKFKISQLRYDPNNAELLMLELRDKYRIQTVEVKQSYNSLSAATHWFEQLVYKGQIHHADNPVLNWNLQSTRIKRNGELIMVDKSLDNTRIDGIAATIIGLTGLMDKPKEETIYTQRGIICL